MRWIQKLAATIVAYQTWNVNGFSIVSDSKTSNTALTRLQLSPSDDNHPGANNRRVFLQQQLGGLVLGGASSSSLLLLFGGSPVWAAEEKKELTAADQTEIVRTALYYVLRVREATEQETRLIKSGKFKDVQRANVKLAVKFMLENYRLSDNFIKASTFLTGNRKIQAVNAGQECIQNLQTITEYFDSSDVQNIKIGANSMAGKESLVLNGLDASRKNIDTFLSYFNPDDIEAVKSKIATENELNEKEFDNALGAILNSAPKP